MNDSKASVVHQIAKQRSSTSEAKKRKPPCQWAQNPWAFLGIISGNTWPNCCWKDQKNNHLGIFEKVKNKLSQAKTQQYIDHLKYMKLYETWDILHICRISSKSTTKNPLVSPAHPGFKERFKTCNQILIANQCPPRFGARTKPVKMHRDQTPW